MPDTSSNTKRIAKNTMLLYFRMLLTMGVSLYTSRVILNALGATDYGLNNLIAGVIAMFAYVNNTLSTSTSRFITFELGRNDLKRVGEIFNNAYGIHLCYAGFLFLVAETVGLWFVNNKLNIPAERLTACNVVYQISIASSFLSITLVPRNALIIAYERMNVYAYIGIYDAIVKLIIAFIIRYCNTDKFILLVSLQFVNSVLIYLFYWLYCKRYFSDVSKLTFNYSKQIIRSMLGFTTWSLFGSTAMMARNHGVTILINIFFNATINAANAIAYQINNAITSFTTNFTIAMNPQITKSYAAGEYETTKKLIFSGGKFSFYMLLLLCYPILFETEFILNLWLDSYPEYTVEFTRLILVLSLVEIFNQSVGCAVQATGKIKWYQIIISCIQLLTFPVTYVLFSYEMPPYAALSTMVTLGFIAVIVRLYFIKKLLSISPIEYLTQVLIRSFFVAGVALIVPYVITTFYEESVKRLFFTFLLSTIFSGIVIYTAGINNEEKKFVRKLVLKVIKKNEKIY